jgi:hypothetical protein
MGPSGSGKGHSHPGTGSGRGVDGRSSQKIGEDHSQVRGWVPDGNSHQS